MERQRPKEMASIPKILSMLLVLLLAGPVLAISVFAADGLVARRKG